MDNHNEKQGAQHLALLVHVTRDGCAINNEEEFIGLVRATGAQTACVCTANVRTPDPRLFIGLGKASQICDQVREHQPSVVIFNLELSPSQERNLEKHVHCRVIDRTRLILDIFALRASSHEGKLQVELAQLSYLSTRLVRGWTHLERQRGGIGLRGPGETQLESDRRMLTVRMAQLKKALKRVNKRRQLGRSARHTKVIALAGYTNAGKTSLFNRLCADKQFVADQLFASLDTTLRRISLPGMRQAVLVDTVGFVENLPHQLVEAFASTLEEVVQADLVLQVCDASDQRRSEKIHAVEGVLKEIGAARIPRLMVWNKCDLLPAGESESLLGGYCHGALWEGANDHTEQERPANGYDPLVDARQDRPHMAMANEAVAISVHSGYGLDRLRARIVDTLAPQKCAGWYRLEDSKASKNRAYLYKIGAIRQETYNKEGHLLLYLEADAVIVQQLSGLVPVVEEDGVLA